MLPAIRHWAAGTLILLGGFLSAAPPELAPLRDREREHASAFRESRTPDARWDWIESLAVLGWGLTEHERDREAVTPYRTALDELPDGAESEEPELVAMLHDGLGRALQNSGRYREAESHLARGLAIRQRLEGPEAEKNRGISEGHLGLLHLVRGRYTEAERLFHSALRRTPPDRPDLLAFRHDCLGRYFLTVRAYQQATEHYLRAVELAGRGAEPGDTFLLDLRTNLALCRLRNGENEHALREVRDLLAQSEQSPLRRAGWHNLAATILAGEKSFREAETHQDQALALLSSLDTGNEAARGTYLRNLGSIRLQAGRPSEALAPLRKAADLLRLGVEEHHQALVETLYEIAQCQLDLGSPDAQAAVRAARQAAGELMSNLIAGGYERELLTFRSRVDLHSIVCRTGDATAIADSLLHGKGLVLRAVLDSITRFQQRSRHRARLQVELDRLLLGDREANAARVGELRALIRELGSGQGAHPPDAIDWRQVQGTLPPGAVYIDCVRYRPTPAEAHRYGAVLIPHQGEPRWIPLDRESAFGMLKLVHQSLERRAHILRTNSGAPGLPIAPLLRKLHQSFWQPLAEALPEGTREIFLCPEGQMHLLPFPVLRGPSGRFLCEEDLTLHLLDTGRSLLDPPIKEVDVGTPWVIAGLSRFATHRERAQSGPIAWGSALANLADLPTVPRETASLHKTAPAGSRVFLDQQASEESLRSLETAPGILHLASHGLHVALPGDLDLGADPSVLYENGVLLAPAGDDDGILFPEEVATLNLRGTRLVTLSTCRSALGRPVGGEGLLGLRRGFAKAGARHILASLWEIPDEATASLMSSFYRAVAKGAPPATTLWRLQAAQFRPLRNEDSRSAKLETAILSYGGFLLTSPGGTTR